MDSRCKVKGDLRPTDYEYACLSKHVYSVQDTTLEVGMKFDTPFHSWKICFLSAPSYCGYFGAVYECEEIKHYCIAHRGTNNIVDIVEDYLGVLRNKCSYQKTEASRVVDLVVEKIRMSGNGYTLSFTGHSLGAFLAELSVCYATVALDYPNVHAVTFESPGSLQSMKCCFSMGCWQKATSNSSTPESLTSGESSCCESSIFSLSKYSSWPSLQMPSNNSSTSLQSLSSTNFSSIIKSLDIITYVCYPNVVNICNEHAGTLYAINISIDDHKLGWPQRLFSTHSILGVVEWFQKFHGGDRRCIRMYMAEWPKKYAESQVFFKHALFQDGMLRAENLLDDQYDPSSRKPVKTKSYNYETRTKSFVRDASVWLKKQKNMFNLRFDGNFNAVHVSTNALPIHHFSIPFRDFLKYFYQKRRYIFKKYTPHDEVLRKVLRESWRGFNMPEPVVEELSMFYLRQNKLYIREVFCKECNIHDFRKLLSCWLEMTGFTVDELISDDLIDEHMLRFKGSKPHNSRD